VPTEILRSICLPSARLQHKLVALGADLRVKAPVVFEGLLSKVLQNIRRSLWVLMAWMRAQGHAIDRRNGKEGLASQRVVCSFDASGLGWFAALGERAVFGEPPSWAHGSLAGWSRPEPTLAQLSCVWRAGCKSSATMLFDAANAFGSSRLDRLVGTVDVFGHPAHPLGGQRQGQLQAEPGLPGGTLVVAAPFLKQGLQQGGGRVAEAPVAGGRP